MAELEADTVVILSSELISKIVGEYFNRKMFKEAVEIVDLKPTENGYMFSVAFVPKQQRDINKTEAAAIQLATDKVSEYYSQMNKRLQDANTDNTNGLQGLVRDQHGRFTKAEVK